MPYKLDFKKLAEDIDIAAVAKLLQLAVIKDHARCPVCDSDRALQLFTDSNSFRCHSAEISSDCISLYAHINGVGMYKAALALQEHFQTADAAGKVPTPPTRSAAGTPKGQPSSTKPAKPERAFDPEEYAARLQYTPEIAELGISEADAVKLGIGYASTGFHRGSVVIAIRHPTGEIAGFAGIKDGQLKLPAKWVESKVIEFKKRA